MADQEIVLTMHTLNKYGIPCTDVTDYETPSGTTSGEASVLYMQNVPSVCVVHTKMKSTAYTEPDVEDDPNPTNGMMGFLYCDFHDSQVDYYSIYSGKMIYSGELPATLVKNDDPYLNPMVNINSDYASMCLYPLAATSKTYKSYIRDDYGNYTLKTTIDLARWPFDDYFNWWTAFTQYNPTYIEDGQPSSFTYWDSGGVQSQSVKNGDTYLVRDTEAFCPDFLVNETVYFNSSEIPQPYIKTGYDAEFEKWNADSILPNQGVLFSRYYTENDYYIRSKIDLLKNDLLNFSEVRDIKALGVIEIFTAMYSKGIDLEYFDHYFGEITVFDKDSNGGGWEIKGRYINGILYIYLKNGDTQKWYDSEGRFLYDINLPTGDYVSHRINGDYYFYYLVSSGSDSFLYKYNLNTGYKEEFLLDNTYGDTYELVNRQLLMDQYIFARVGSSSTCVFIDVFNPSGSITKYVNMDVSVETGYYIIPNFMKMEYGNGYNPYLLQLCNKLRTNNGRNEMEWTPIQELVAQNHASWCAYNGVFSHTGSGGSDVRQRCREAGIYLPSSENLTTVLKSNNEREQLDAFNNWIGSPHHLSNITASANKLMCFAYATYPSHITELVVDAGMWDPISQSYTTESSVLPIPESYRGKLRIYVQNFIGY